MEHIFELSIQCLKILIAKFYGCLDDSRNGRNERLESSRVGRHQYMDRKINFELIAGNIADVLNAFHLFRMGAHWLCSSDEQTNKFDWCFFK